MSQMHCLQPLCTVDMHMPCVAWLLECRRDLVMLVVCKMMSRSTHAAACMPELALVSQPKSNGQLAAVHGLLPVTRKQHQHVMRTAACVQVAPFLLGHAPLAHLLHVSVCISQVPYMNPERPER